MKFRYIITDMFDGSLKGTNSDSVAAELSACDDFFVYDTEAGVWLIAGHEPSELEEIKS